MQYKGMSILDTERNLTLIHQTLIENELHVVGYKKNKLGFQPHVAHVV